MDVNHSLYWDLHLDFILLWLFQIPSELQNSQITSLSCFNTVSYGNMLQQQQEAHTSLCVFIYWMEIAILGLPYSEWLWCRWNIFFPHTFSKCHSRSSTLHSLYALIRYSCWLLAYQHTVFRFSVVPALGNSLLATGDVWRMKPNRRHSTKSLSHGYDQIHDKEQLTGGK